MDNWTKQDFPEAFDALPRERQDLLLDWIYNNIAPIKTFNDRHTSYGLKHLVHFENGEDEYFTNGEFKGAMLKAGFDVQNRAALNWVFNISEKSAALIRK